ncbi:MAG: alpha/beta hydrolase [Roseburia sp.]|nr:alpha/beta hydrolase [Roseburia sp.]
MKKNDEANEREIHAETRAEDSMTDPPEENISENPSASESSEGADVDVKNGAALAAESASEPQVKLSRRERIRRKWYMRGARALFRAIDIVFYGPQNSCPYVNRRNSKTIRVEKDIVYDDELSDVCVLDFYEVPSDEAKPAVLLIHGGGFSAGGKKYRKGLAQYFALNGFAVFSIDYGLAPKYVFPEPIRHIVNAANFVYDNAQRFNIDASKIITTGDSAGGYFSAMLAAFNCNDRLGDVFGFAPKFRIFGTILDCGLYDLQTVFNTKYILNVDDAVFLSFIGIRENDYDEYIYKDCCTPIEHITKDFPPTYVISAAADILCKGQSDVLIEKFKQCGVYYECYESHKFIANHCFPLLWRTPDAIAANEGMMEFAHKLINGEIAQ